MNLRVTFYVSKQACSGYINLHDEERLSDFLNDRFAKRSDGSNGFIKITDAAMTLPDNSKERLPEATINKSAIQLVAIQEEDQARGLGGKEGMKSYPFIDKTPMLVRMHLQEFSIIGNMHFVVGQTPLDLLEEKQMFIPLTQAKMLTPDMTSWWKTPFVAVNREKITILSNANGLGVN